MDTLRLRSGFSDGKIEAGCDEAGRGCLAGPVVASAVILPKGYIHPFLNDSKKLTSLQREKLRFEIERDALSWAVGFVDNQEIDRINILNASILAMHKALELLSIKPDLILVDGNHFHPFRDIPHQCITGGDSLYLSIAAASILAKTYRDEYMCAISKEYPQYEWDRNKGYPTLRHREAINKFGISPYHRKSFRLFKPTLFEF